VNRPKACLLRLAVLAAGLSLPAAAFSAPPEPRSSTLVPHTVYVGDPARLILIFDPSAAPMAPLPLVVDTSAILPRTDDATVSRIELDLADGELRALIDFVAFRSGTIELPEIRLEGFAPGAMKVQIASILAGEDGQGELSSAQEPLAASGTALLIYGSVFALLAFVACVSWLALKGLPLLRGAADRRRRALASRSLRRVVSSLRAGCDALDPAEALAILSRELRAFLTFRTGLNYLAMTSEDVRRACRLSGGDDVFVAALFRRGDEVRFGGKGCPPAEILDFLRGVEDLAARMDAAGGNGGC